MAYNLPTFNIQVDIYWPSAALGNNPTMPIAAAPDVVSDAQLRYPRFNQALQPFSSVDPSGIPVVGTPLMYLYLPAGTDIRGPRLIGATTYRGWVVVPTGGVRLYRVVAVEDSAAGFDNESRVAQVQLWNVADLDPLPPIIP